MGKISWTDRVRNEEMLPRVKEERKIIQTNSRKDNWIGHILCRNCFLKHVIRSRTKDRGKDRSVGKTRKKT
jgi:hypothetical protein